MDKYNLNILVLMLRILDKTIKIVNYAQDGVSCVLVLLVYTNFADNSNKIFALFMMPIGHTMEIDFHAHH
jgi:hypothetical protein